MKRIAKIIIVIIFFIFNKIGFAQQYPNSLTIENKGLSLSEIKNWMYAFGELSENNNNFTLEELIQKSHLINKEKPYSIYQFNNYGINTEGVATIITFTSDCSDINAQEIYFDNKSGLFFRDKNYNTLANYNFVRILKTHYFGEINNGKFERIGECVVNENLVPESLALYETDLLIFPNPFNNYFNIDLNNSSNYNKIEIIEPDGKLILDVNIKTLLNEKNQVEIDASTWASGIYFLKVSGVFGIEYRKMIKY